MKRHLILLSAVLIVIFACNNTTEKKDNLQKLLDKQVNYKDTTINIPCIEPFIQITSIGNVDIEYSQGEYNIQATGSPEVIPLLETSFDSGILTIGMKNETVVELSTIKNKQNIRLLITSPELKYLALCGNGNFESNGIIETELFQVGNFASGIITIDSLKCNIFKFENNDIGKAIFKNVECKTTNISTFGTSKTDITIKAQKDISVYTGGESTIAMNAKTNRLEILANNNSKGEFDIKCANLEVFAKNQSSLSLKGATKNKKINKDYGCKIDTFLN